VNKWSISDVMVQILGFSWLIDDVMVQIHGFPASNCAFLSHFHFENPFPGENYAF